MELANGVYNGWETNKHFTGGQQLVPWWSLWLETGACKLYPLGFIEIWHDLNGKNCEQNGWSSPTSACWVKLDPLENIDHFFLSISPWQTLMFSSCNCLNADLKNQMEATDERSVCCNLDLPCYRVGDWKQYESNSETRIVNVTWHMYKCIVRDTI